VGDWYVIGIALGVGVAFGVLAAALLAWLKVGWAASTVVAIAAGLVAGFITNRWIGSDWVGPVAGVAGGLIGSLSGSVVVRGAIRRGGTPGGVAFLLGSFSLMIFLLALVPAAGFLVAVIVPIAAFRNYGRDTGKHAGLRTLAK
jgi:hypothetical protein